jgi:hypothetical protein
MRANNATDGPSDMNRPVHVEPNTVYPEVEFEAALVALVESFSRIHPASSVLRRFGLDIAVCMKDGALTRLALIEAKSYNGQRLGGIGFGNGRGEGPQVDILLQSPGQLATLDAHIRWAIADAKQPPGAARYALLTCTEAREAVMGHVSRGKQNNFSVARLKSKSMDWSVFCDRLARFLGVKDGPAI